MSDVRIAITGSSGRLGGRVARRLSEWGLTQRLVVRDARRAPAGPAGHSRVAAVAQDDIADVAAAVLRRVEPHVGRTYELTGPAALTLDEVAVALTRHLGREVRYVDETFEEAYRSREKYAAEKWQVDAWVSTYTAIKAGELARVTSDVERVVGHPPTGLEEVLRNQER